jgi:SAM-dependent methyltransferase
VRCERVFQHLDDPDRAATEIARVLRPDGRVMVSDSDWSTMILRPGEQATVDAVRRFWLGQFPNPRSGQRLYGQLTAAGLVVDQTCPPGSTKDASGAESLINRLINVEGLLPDDQRDRLLADLRAGVDRGDFHFSVTMFAVLAHKPGQCGRL